MDQDDLMDALRAAISLPEGYARSTLQQEAMIDRRAKVLSLQIRTVLQEVPADITIGEFLDELQTLYVTMSRKGM